MKKAKSAAAQSNEKPVTVKVFEAGVDKEAVETETAGDMQVEADEIEVTDGAKTDAPEVEKVEVETELVEESEQEPTSEVAEKHTKALPAGEVVAASEGVEITKMKKSGRKSMSGMVVEVVKHPEAETKSETVTDLDEKTTDEGAGEKKEEKVAVAGGEAGEMVGEPRFSQAKSALIGVAVAVAVAVAGFIGIGIFSGDQRKCTVLFDSNGGTTVAGTEIVCGKAVAEPDEPTKEGFSFQGWLLEGDPFDFNKMTVYNNSVLVARWAVDEGTETVKVRFNTAGGSEMSEIELAKGATLSEPVRKPVRSGYTFGGWYVGNERYEFGRAVEADLTLTARWVKVQTPNNNVSRPPENSQNPGNNETPEEPEEVKVAELAVSNVEREVESGAFDVTVGVFPGDAAYELEVGGGSAVSSCTVKSKNVLTCTTGEAGETTITVTDKKSGVGTSFKVTVKAKVVELTGVALSGTQSVEVGKTVTLVAALAPEGATGEMSWSSTDESVATVAGGVVTGVKAGSATIKVIVKSGEKEFSAELAVTVTEAKTEEPPVAGGGTEGGQTEQQP